MIKKYFSSLFVLLLLSMILVPFSLTKAKVENDWYIKDFKTKIEVNKDSSLTITEEILADCGNGADKHGIFRILPTQFKDKDQKIIKTPIELVSITNFLGQPYSYTTLKNRFDHTITWKIGDPNVIVKGENQYRITYRVKNAVQKDHLYWNLNGNFWDLETDMFVSQVTFSPEININKNGLELYSGEYGNKQNDLAVTNWQDNTLTVTATKQLSARQGISIYMPLPENYFTPYVPTFLEKYGDYLYALIPFLILAFCLKLWSKYGRDPVINPTIAPEFEIPGKLNPLEMGLLTTDGNMKSQFITATIINLAVKGKIKIEELEKKSFLEGKDFQLSLVNRDNLEYSEKALVDELFPLNNIINISELKKRAYLWVESIRKIGSDQLVKRNLIVKRSRTIFFVYLFLSFVFFTASTMLFSFSLMGGLSVFSGSIILLIFSFLMKRRTYEGAEMNRRIQGFKLYMNTAERFRQQWNEKENIFEKFLPYAILFGITKEWIKKMEGIYGKEYFAAYHPVWYVGSINNFDANSFDSAINSISSSMAASTASSSSGGAGGGGGGGGGGGW